MDCPHFMASLAYTSSPGMKKTGIAPLETNQTAIVQKRGPWKVVLLGPLKDDQHTSVENRADRAYIAQMSGFLWLFYPTQALGRVPTLKAKQMDA